MDVSGAVNRCQSEGYRDEDIVVDILMIMSNVTLTPWGPDPDVKTQKAH